MTLKALSDTNRTLFCAAAGNEVSEVGVPNFGSKIEVNQGDYVDVTAPGSAILSTVPYNASEDLRFDAVDRTYAYQSFNGTSMATPHVAGVAALLKSLYPEATPQQIKAAIVGGADGFIVP